MGSKKCKESFGWQTAQQRSKDTWNTKKFDNIKLYMQQPKYCKHCGTVIQYDDRRKDFCNRSCSASYNNKGKNRREMPYKEYKCLNCDNIITRGKYCSNACQGEFRTRTSVNEWINGKFKRTERIPPYIKKYLMELHNSSCQLCGWNKVNPATGKSPLQVDHKDGDCRNHLFENLQLICPSCHSLTPNYGGLNKGKSTRYKRYTT